MSDQIEQTVTQLETDISTFRARMDPAAANVAATEAREAYLASFNRPGLTGNINTLTPAMLKAFEQEWRDQYDGQLKADAQRLQAEIDAADAGMATTISTLAQLPHPIDKSWGTAASADTHELRKLRIGLELDRTERKLTGKTLAQIAAAYEASDDTRDEAAVWFIESQLGAGWPDVARQPADTDVASLQRLQRAVEARQLARVERDHPTVLAAAQRLKGLRSATTAQLFRHLLKDGRGLARVS